MALHETTLADWLRDGPRLVRERPDITTVALRDREPLRRHKGGWLWRPARGSDLLGVGEAVPHDVYSRLPPGTRPSTGEALPPGLYANDVQATAALSAALIAWAEVEAARLWDMPEERLQALVERNPPPQSWYEEVPTP